MTTGRAVAPAASDASPIWRRLAAAASLTAFLALLYVLDRAGLDRSVLRAASAPALLAAYSVTAATGWCCALVPHRRRRILLVAALVVAPIVLGAWSLALLGYVAWVIAVARAPVPFVVQLIAASAAWAVVPVARVAWLDADAQADTIVFAIIWAGQLYAAFYLIIERARLAPGQRPGVLGDAFYLLALPRLVVPFFQPISPHLMARSVRAHPSPKQLARAAGLAAYAATVAVLAHVLGGLVRQIDSAPLAFAVRFCALYARATCTIFTAIAVFRLLGVHLPAGFHLPFLSRSFAEFFRRFNYYVRDAVLSLFYYPLLGRLRQSMSPRAASILAAYLAILFGSFLLHDVLIPLSVTADPRQVIARFLDPLRVLGFFALWTLTIVPTAGIAKRREPPRTWLRTVIAVVVFNAIHTAVWYAQVVGHDGR